MDLVPPPDIINNKEEYKVEEVQGHQNKAKVHNSCVTNFIQLISPQPVDRFSQTKLLWKAPNEGYLHICGMYKSNNE